MRRRYADTGLGQVHLRTLAPSGQASQPPLVCLHPIPYSGLYFTTIAPLLADRRAVIAPDYPGYGGSDAVTDRPSIADYAAAMLQALAPRDGQAWGPVDLMGFHTGCLVAAEMALARPERVGRIVMIDAPVFEAAERAAMYDRATAQPAITETLDSLAPVWDTNVAKRLGSMPLMRAFALFVEQLRSGGRAAHGFHAAFTYSGENRLHRLTGSVLVIATRSGLLEPTRRAARRIPGARLVERLDIERAVLEEGAQAIAADVLGFLNQSDCATNP